MDREQDQTKDANVYPPEAEQMRPSHASPGSLLGIHPPLVISISVKATTPRCHNGQGLTTHFWKSADT